MIKMKNGTTICCDVGRNEDIVAGSLVTFDTEYVDFKAARPILEKLIIKNAKPFVLTTTPRLKTGFYYGVAVTDD